MVMVDMAMAGTDTEQKKIDTGMNSVYHVLNNYGKNRIYYKYKKEIITVTGNVVNKIFKVGNAWVKR